MIMLQDNVHPYFSLKNLGKKCSNTNMASDKISYQNMFKNKC